MALYNNNSIIGAERPVSASEIDDVQQVIGRRLPEDLRSHFLEANGGKPKKQSCFTPDGAELVVHQFLSMRPGGEGDFESTFLQTKVDDPFLPRDLIPFAIDPGGDFFCVSDGGSRAGQVFFFYSSDAERPDEATVFLSPSLHDFIETLR